MRRGDGVGLAVDLGGEGEELAEPFRQARLAPKRAAQEGAAGGALAGAAVAKIIDGDVGTGALIGAAGGALCDDAGVCQRRY